MVKRMRDEKRLLGSEEEMPGSLPMLIGVRGKTPSQSRTSSVRSALPRRWRRGADYVQTQCVYDVQMFAEWMKAVRNLGLHERCRILAGVTPLKSAGMTRYMAGSVPGIIIPPEIVKRMSDAPKGKGAETGLAICREIIEQLRGIEGVAGIHIMAIEWEQKVHEIVETAGLLPRPAP